MRAARPALCALLLACAQGDNVTDLATLTDDQTEAVLAGEGAAAWTWASGLAVAALCCCWAAVPLRFGCAVLRFGFDGSFSPMGGYSPPYSQEEADLEGSGLSRPGHDHHYLEGVTKQEAFFITTLPFVFALTWLVPTFAFRGKPPAWLQLALIIPLVWRTCRVEQRLTQKSVCTLVTSSWASCPFLFSKLEVTDAVTDGLAIATVFVLERANWVFHARLEAAWGAGPIGRLFAPLVLRFGLSGLMLLVQIGAAVSQLGLAVMEGTKAGANVAGLGALEANLVKQYTWSRARRTGRRPEDFEEGRDRKTQLFLVRKFLEGACQLLLQSSAILATGTGILGDPTLLASVMITSCLLWKEGVHYITNNEGVWVYGVLMCCIVAGTALRLGMSETCGDSLLYDVGSFQCVPAPLPTRS